MGNSPTLPIPGMTNDPAGSTINPTDLLRQIYMQRQPMPMAQGTISTGPAMPQPQTALHPMPVPQGGGVPQGEFQTKGAHQRASMQSLATTLQATVAKANNALQQHEQKVLTQKTDAYTHAVQGIAEAEEMLKSDPTSMEALQMKQRNTDFLNAFLDPTTPEGRKNIKLLEKAYAVQNEEKTPEQIAAQSSAKKVRQQADLTAMAERLKSGSAFPETAGISPLSQIHGEMVKQGIMPKAATGTAILNNQTQSAKALTADEQKQQDFAIKRERLGLDEKGNPLPLDKLPLTQRAKVESERTMDDYRKAQSEYARAHAAAVADPRSLQNQLALIRAGAMQKFAAASMLRSQVQLLNYRMNSTATGEDGNPIPGATVINGQIVGPRFAAAATKAIQTQAQFIDADGAIDNLSAAAKNLNDSGQKFNDPRLVKLLNDPHFKNDDTPWFENQMSSGIGSTLTSQQRDYLIAQKQARENIMAIRRVIGTGVSVKAMDAITSTLPGVTTPDYDYAQRQIQAVKGQLLRLQQGVPKINIPQRTNQPGTAGSAPIAPPDKLTSDLNEALKF